MRGRLLIVEDQPIFREGLKKMIMSKSTGWTVVAEASDGQEAIRQIEIHHPDLVLTDIRMPVMDGIGLIRHIHAHASDTLTVIVTGYRDFEYAQSAVQYGVMDYLIKPCNEDTVDTMLKKAYERWVQGVSEKNRRREQARKLQEAALRELCAALPYDREQLGTLLEEVRGYEAWILGVASYFPEGKGYRQQEMGLLQFALLNILEELCVSDEAIQGRLVAVEADKIILFLPQAEIWNEEIADQARQTVLRLLGLQLSAMNAGIVDTEEELGSRYRSYAGQLPRSEVNGAVGHGQQEHVQELRLNLMSKIVMGFVAETQREIGESLEQLSRQPVAEAKRTAYSMALALRDIADKEFHSERLPELQGARLVELQRAETTERVSDWLREVADGFMEAYEAWRNRSNAGVISKVLSYLERNYTQECALSDLAAKFHVNDTYLSKLFKKETGENFSAYLTRLRMNKAKLLLGNTEMKIFEIASMIGYDDPNYFTNVFRNTFRISPTEYRKTIRN